MKNITIKLTAALLLFVVVGSTTNSFNIVSAMDIPAEWVEAELTIPYAPAKEAAAPASNTQTGKVKFFNGEKGFGFITPDSGDPDVFVHVSGLIDEIGENDIVSFEVVEVRRGLRAENVKKA